MSPLSTDVYLCLAVIDDNPFIYNKIVRVFSLFREWTRKNPGYVSKIRDTMSVMRRFIAPKEEKGKIWFRREYYEGLTWFHMEPNKDLAFYYKYRSDRSPRTINYCCHRLDKPAVEWDNGTIEYRKMGLLDRVDGPALIFPNGTGIWFATGKLHRVDGPVFKGVLPKNIDLEDYGIDEPTLSMLLRARSYPVELWCINGDFHRVGGPAEIYEDFYYNYTGGNSIYAKFYRWWEKNKLIHIITESLEEPGLILWRR